MMVEIFKTNVVEASQAGSIVAFLLQYFRFSRVSFDLEDCDKILRVEGESIPNTKIIEILTKKGFQCHVLD
jgi:hypothetical protein